MSDTTVTKPSDEDVLEAMRDVVDPELGINVVDLGWSTASPSTTTTPPSST